MGIGAANRAHFVENDVVTTLGQLPGRFGACKTTADHMNLFFAHPLELDPLALGFNAYYGLLQRHLHHKVRIGLCHAPIGYGIDWASHGSKE